MRKVKRAKIPESLKANGAKWTKKLLLEIKCKGGFSKVASSYKNKYNQPDVRVALEKMYKGKCCYCETGIGASSYEHIEHLRPKSNSQFYHLIYEWKNLHWCCQKCNMAKKDQWDDQNPIIDPTVDDPANFIKFDVIIGKVVAKNDRGKQLFSMLI